MHNVWTIDHFTDFPGHPQKTIEEKYPDQRIRFECFPTKRRYMAGKLFEFYSLPDSYFGKTQQIDLVFIDGPPFYYNHGREAALYWIYPYLSDNAVILMDDGERVQMEQRYLVWVILVLWLPNPSWKEKRFFLKNSQISME